MSASTCRAQVDALSHELLVRRLASAGVRPESIILPWEGNAWEQVLTDAVRRHMPGTKLVGYDNLNFSSLALSLYPSAVGGRYPSAARSRGDERPDVRGGAARERLSERARARGVRSATPVISPSLARHSIAERELRPCRLARSTRRQSIELLRKASSAFGDDLVARLHPASDATCDPRCAARRHPVRARAAPELPAPRARDALHVLGGALRGARLRRPRRYSCDRRRCSTSISSSPLPTCAGSPAPRRSYGQLRPKSSRCPTVQPGSAGHARSPAQRCARPAALRGAVPRLSCDSGDGQFGRRGLIVEVGREAVQRHPRRLRLGAVQRELPERRPIRGRTRRGRSGTGDPRARLAPRSQTISTPIRSQGSGSSPAFAAAPVVHVTRADGHPVMNSEATAPAPGCSIAAQISTRGVAIASRAAISACGVGGRNVPGLPTSSRPQRSTKVARLRSESSAALLPWCSTRSARA